MIVREPRKPDETEDQFEDREKAHWAQVAKNEQELLDNREWLRKRLGLEDSDQ